MKFLKGCLLGHTQWSLSARRAWIEIIPNPDLLLGIKSLSARRAWIEIKDYDQLGDKAFVALRKEGVD